MLYFRSRLALFPKSFGLIPELVCLTFKLVCLKSELVYFSSELVCRIPELVPFLNRKKPTWPQLGSKNRANMARNSIPNSIIFLMPFGIDLLVGFRGFWVPNSRQVGTKMGSKIDVNFESHFSKNIVFPFRKSNVF